MFYVAITRVKRTSDIRVVYFEVSKTTVKHVKENGKSPPHGLDHVLKLKRPDHFDSWLHAYDDQGRWNDDYLKKQAAADKKKALTILQGPTPLNSCKYTVPRLKVLSKALGVTPDNAPGKSYPNKYQYLVTLYPIWVSAKVGRRIPQRYSVSTDHNNSRPKNKQLQQESPRTVTTTTFNNRSLLPEIPPFTMSTSDLTTASTISMNL